MRPIDADAIEFEHDHGVLNGVAFVGGRTPGKTLTMVQVALKKMIENAPTIDVEPVRHGRWIPEIVGCTETVFKCSKCCRLVKQMNDYAYKASKHVGSSYPYCHCGAKMDLEAEDEKEEQE